MPARRVPFKPEPLKVVQNHTPKKVATGAATAIRWLPSGHGRRYYAGSFQIAYAHEADKGGWRCFPLHREGELGVRGIWHKTEEQMHQWMLGELSS